MMYKHKSGDMESIDNLNPADIVALSRILGAVEDERLKRVGMNCDYAVTFERRPSGRLSAMLKIVTITNGQIRAETINFI